MASGRASQQAFLGISALLFAASAALTIVWCASMAAMGGMRCPVAGRGRWRGCGCPDRRRPARRRVPPDLIRLMPLVLVQRLQLALSVAMSRASQIPIGQHR
jgi:hypothetical protein